MNSRALLRRAFPYLVLGICGFALAYVIVFVFVLPSRILPPEQRPYVPDSNAVLVSRPGAEDSADIRVDTGIAAAPIQRAQSAVSDAIPSPQQTGPVEAPDLVGMALPDARGVLNSMRLQIVVQHDTSSFQPPNTVLSQAPAAATLVQPDATITVTVSYFPLAASRDTAPVQRGSPGSPVPPVVRADSDTTGHS